jgi:hypothetical protein
MITPIEVTPSAIGKPVKTTRLAATSRKQIVFKLMDAEGKPIDLKEEQPNPPAPTPVFGTEPPAQGSNVTIRLRAREGELYGPVQFDVVGTLLPERGFVQFLLTETETQLPGAFLSEIGRFAGDYLVDTWPVLVVIEPSVFQRQQQYSGPVTIPDLRMALLDNNDGADGAPFNNLLTDVEFSDVELATAIRRVVDMWNETPPNVYYFTTSTFPYRYWWIQGATALALRAGAARYRRNRLAYAAGGVSVDDQSKADEYEQTSMQRMAEFKEWMMNEKVRINMGYCWGRGL